MSTPVDIDELLHTVEWISSADSAGVEADAYISRADGKIYWSGEGVDEERA